MNCSKTISRFYSILATILIFGLLSKKVVKKLKLTIIKYVLPVVRSFDD